MLKIDAALVQSAQQANSPQDVIPLVKAAIAIEHATIPLYLTAWLTIQPGTNDEAADAIREIFVDEMLHMGLMANLLIALGEDPRFADQNFVPKYPDRLPFGIGGDLELRLRKCDMAQVETFVAIEKPEHPINIPERNLLEVVEPHFDTIGAFYKALGAAIERLDAAAFSDPRVDRQVTNMFDDGNLGTISNAAEAVAAINLIRLQGEGAQTPFAQGDTAAHYYRFEQLAKQKRLHQTPAGPVFGPDAFPFDPALVIDMEEDVTPATYAAGTPQRAAVDTFIARYSDMLRKIEAAFNGNEAQFQPAVAVMRRLGAAGRDVLALDSQTSPGKKAGLVFSYAP